MAQDSESGAAAAGPGPGAPPPPQGGRTVVVIGAGGAGLAAAVEAYRAGAARVVVLDKAARVGGNTAAASSGLSAAGTPAQAAAGIADSAALFRADILRSGGGAAAPELAAVLAGESAAAAALLESDLGVDLSLLTQLGGHSVPRTHRSRPPAAGGGPALNFGGALIGAYRAFLARPEVAARVQVLTGARALRLLLASDGSPGGDGAAPGPGPGPAAVTGVRVMIAQAAAGPRRSGTEETLLCDSVVIATGGFGASRELLAQHAPRWARLPTTNGPFATGDGLALGAAAGAALEQIGSVQVHPTAFVDPADPLAAVKWLCPEGFRGAGGILLDASGRRFCDELGLRDAVSEAILARGFDVGGPAGPAGGGPAAAGPGPVPAAAAYHDHPQAAARAGSEPVAEAGSEAAGPGALAGPAPGPPPAAADSDVAVAESGRIAAYLVLNDDCCGHFAVPDIYRKKGLVTTAPDGAALAAACGWEPSALADTLAAYSAVASGKEEDVFGKRVFPVKAFRMDAPLHVMRVMPATHYCMGGLKIDSRARVLAMWPPAANVNSAADSAADSASADGAAQSVVRRSAAGEPEPLPREPAGRAPAVPAAAPVPIPIPGLFAAGEVTGGVHGANRLAGNGLLDSLVFGRVAGRHAAAAAGPGPGAEFVEAAPGRAAL